MAASRTGQTAGMTPSRAHLVTADDTTTPPPATATPQPSATRRTQPPTTITAYRDGPLIVRGDFELLDADGERIEELRRIVALCRCGRSSRRPLCDGSHTVNGWRCP